MSVPVISVVMPAYNAEKHIAETIQSVLSQSFTDFEFIIVNDCSTDETASIISSFAETDSRIKVITNDTNVGVSASRNIAINACSTDWIALIDSDDIWRGDKLLKQILLIESKSDVSFVFSASSFVGDSGKKRSYILHVPQKINFRELLKQNVISCSSVLIKKNYLLKYRMPGDHMHEDFAVWLRILKEENIFAYGIDEPLITYRITEGSRSANKLRAAKMTYLVYRHSGLNFFSSLYNMLFYTIRSLKKYYKLHK